MDSPSLSANAGASLLERRGRTDWPLEMQALALAVYAETGSLKTASRETGIPPNTICRWVEDEDGAQLLESLRLAVRARMAHRLLAGAMRGIELVLDGLEHGDTVIHPRTGQMVRVPVKAKDAAFITSILIDKHALITGAMAQGKGIGAQLHGLADKLAGLIADAMKANSAPVPLTKPEPEPAEDGPVIG